MNRVMLLAVVLLACVACQDMTNVEGNPTASTEDLGGDWVLTHFARGEEVSEGIEITLQFDQDRIAGKSACNRYNGTLSEGNMPGEIRLDGPMATTRMMCPPLQMDAEQRYLRALENLQRYSFTAGRLALSWSGEDGMGELIFSRLSPERSE